MKSKLKKLIIKNFRSIGSSPIEINLDDIVVLVGPNNVGKSSILRAYELLMLDGSKEGEFTIEDFPKKEIDDDNLPEIELHTIVETDNCKGLGEEWRVKIDEEHSLVKEKWVWEKPGNGNRKGYNYELQRWAEEGDDEMVPWGPPNKAQSFRPYPHRITPFATPEEQTNEFLKLLDSIVKNKLQSDKENDDSSYSDLLDKISDLQKKVFEQGKEEIGILEEELSKELSNVFPNYIVKFDPRLEEPSDDQIKIFGDNSELRIGEKGGFMSTVENQGSGSRRTLVWAALKLLAEQGIKARKLASRAKNPTSISKDRGHLLLMDEPEICLHPSAIREMCNALYNLPKNNRWQVMITTHSPQFIDLAKDNTTIIRVEKNEQSGRVEGTTLFRPDKINLGENDKENLKYLNLYDPYVAEFFFGGKTIIVEGDTEYTAFNYLKALKPEKYPNIHILRARGKATVVSLIKILNHFGSDYSVLHDSDKPKTKMNKGNPAWGSNRNILEAVNQKPKDRKVRLVASLRNFEEAYMIKDYKETKPYNALENMRKKTEAFDEVEKLFDSLLDHEKELPKNSIEWNDIEELEKIVNKLNAE